MRRVARDLDLGPVAATEAFGATLEREAATLTRAVGGDNGDARAAMVELETLRSVVFTLA